MSQNKTITRFKRDIGQSKDQNVFFSRSVLGMSFGPKLYSLSGEKKIHLQYKSGTMVVLVPGGAGVRPAESSGTLKNLQEQVMAETASSSSDKNSSS